MFILMPVEIFSALHVCSKKFHFVSPKFFFVTNKKSVHGDEQNR